MSAVWSRVRESSMVEERASYCYNRRESRNEEGTSKKIFERKQRKDFEYMPIECRTIHDICCYISVPQLTPTLMINTNISPVQSRHDNQPAGSNHTSPSLSSFPLLRSPRYSTPSALFLYPSLLSKLSGSLPAASMISTFGCSSVISILPGLLGLN